MKKRNTNALWFSSGSLAAFMLWTFLVRHIDVQSIGPNGSSVGFAAMNAAFHRLTGVHMTLYTVTDWLGLLPFGIVMGFAVLGLVQLIRRKSILKVERSILILGVFYIVVLSAYLFFEKVVINYRPVLINGRPEASYPSSTTMLALCVLPTAMMQLNGRIRNAFARRAALGLLAVLSVFMVIGRLLSGVHWMSDIIGGILLSGGLVALYAFAVSVSDTLP